MDIDQEWENFISSGCDDDISSDDEDFNEIIKQIREATDLLNDIGVIHYDLYCESNVMLKKENNNWIIKIIDYGLSYIDLTDKTDSDYINIIESIEHFNKKHSIE